MKGDPKVIELLNESARERGAMVLVVTHDHRLTPFADHVYTMDDGMLSQAPLSEFTHPHQTPVVNPRRLRYLPQPQLVGV